MWRIETTYVTRRIWGPGDYYLTAGHDGPQVDERKFKAGDKIHRLVSEYVTDPTELQEFVDGLSE